MVQDISLLNFFRLLFFNSCFLFFMSIVYIYIDMKKDKIIKFFFFLLSFALISSYFIFCTEKIFLFCFGLCLSSITLYVLLVIHKEKKAHKILKFHIFADFLIASGLIVFSFIQKSESLYSIWFSNFESTEGIIASVLVFLGSIIKSAQFPFARSITAGTSSQTTVYAFLNHTVICHSPFVLLFCLIPFFEQNQIYKTLIIIIGSSSIINFAIFSMLSNDMKKILAISTTGFLGFVFILFGSGLYEIAGYIIALHQILKFCLLLIARNISRILSEENLLSEMGGLKQYTPQTYFLFKIMVIFLPLVWYTIGGFSSTGVVSTLFSTGQYFVLFVFLLFLIFYFLHLNRLMHLIFEGKNRSNEQVEAYIKEVPSKMRAVVIFCFLYTNVFLFLIKTSWFQMVSCFSKKIILFVPEHSLKLILVNFFIFFIVLAIIVFSFRFSTRMHNFYSHKLCVFKSMVDSWKSEVNIASTNFTAKLYPIQKKCDSILETLRLKREGSSQNINFSLYTYKIEKLFPESLSSNSLILLFLTIFSFIFILLYYFGKMGIK